VDYSQGQQSVVHGESARESEEQCQDSSCHPLWHKRETNSLIAFRADARGPRATSGQGHAYSFAMIAGLNVPIQETGIGAWVASMFCGTKRKSI